MSSSLLALAALLALLIAGVALARGASNVVRGAAVALCILGCAMIVGFCVFGFLATGECADPFIRLAWRAGYTAVAMTSTGLITLLLLPWRCRV